LSDSHSTILAHQFDDLEQQKETCTLGMWAFLATEVMFFGGAFAGYAIYRFYYPEAFHWASREENWLIGAINTGVLLCSSFTMAMAVHEAHEARNRGVIKYVILTMLAALVFLGIKAYEYNHLIHAHKFPGPNFQFEKFPLLQDAAQIFYSFYFAMTGLHALHMVIGLGLMIWLIKLARHDRFSHAYYTPVEMVGLYWHFVDLVWIFLYPLFYLIDRS
jgi:cytochrome c oxidase subunit 3